MILSNLFIYSQLFAAQSLWVVGVLDQPAHLSKYGDVTGAGGTGTNRGLVGLMENGINIITLVAGVYMLYNIIMAGFTYVMHGDNAEELKKANSMINMSIVGLIIMVASFLIAGVIGLLFFGDTNFILTPKLELN